jgi:primosomal protein N' (replication factor Y)
MNPDFNFKQFAEVMVPGGLPETLWYGVPDPMIPELFEGTPVEVSVRGKTHLGIIIALSSKAPEFKVLAISGFWEPRFPLNWIKLLKWMSPFYLSSLNHCAEVALPSKLSVYLKNFSEVPPLKIKSEEVAPELTPDQKKICDALLPLIGSKKFSAHLLHGVTGSGKTRVYLELIRAALKKNLQCLLLVPEIALTPQTKQVFQNHLSTEVVVLHSALGGVAKRLAWQRILSGEARFILGTRSASLIPLHNPGLIIMDEEHDASYKQHDPAPRYHARDLALYLANQWQIPFIAGSATPSLESYYNVHKHNLHLWELPNRVQSQVKPSVVLVDMKKENEKQGSLLLSSLLRESLCETLANGGQAILLYNRRGFATSRVCRSCGHIEACVDCQIPLVYHLKKQVLLCHYCSRCYPVQKPCTQCASVRFEFLGGAIEKAETEVLKWIPGARVLRLDRDTTASRGSFEKMLGAFRQGEYNILLGTQMVAKGHDFPRVRLVGVLSADTGSGLPDFRGSERSFQLMTQVAGRAGRSSEGGGQVIIQTWNPTDPALHFALKQDYKGFSEWELKNRRDLSYPPFARVVLVEISTLNPESARLAIEALVSKLNALKQSLKLQFRVSGPVEAFVAVVRKRYRMQLLLRGDDLRSLRQVIDQASQQTGVLKNSAVRVRIDLDPQTIS